MANHALLQTGELTLDHSHDYHSSTIMSDDSYDENDYMQEDEDEDDAEMTYDSDDEDGERLSLLLVAKQRR